MTTDTVKASPVITDGDLDRILTTARQVCDKPFRIEIEVTDGDPMLAKRWLFESLPAGKAVALIEELMTLREHLRENGYALDHVFTFDKYHSDDGACIHRADDFDGTICDRLEEDHLWPKGEAIEGDPDA